MYYVWLAILRVDQDPYQGIVSDDGSTWMWLFLFCRKSRCVFSSRVNEIKIRRHVFVDCDCGLWTPFVEKDLVQKLIAPLHNTFSKQAFKPISYLRTFYFPILSFFHPGLERKVSLGRARGKLFWTPDSDASEAVEGVPVFPKCELIGKSATPFVGCSQEAYLDDCHEGSLFRTWIISDNVYLKAQPRL